MTNLPFVKPIWAAEPKSYSGAAMTAKYVSLKDAAHIRIMIQTGAWAAGTAAVTVSQATAVAGTGAKALAITKVFKDTAVAGTLVETAVASNTFNLDTANSLYILEIDSAELDVAGGFDCLTLAVASPGANADFYGVTYLLEDLRYAQATPPTVLTD